GQLLTGRRQFESEYPNAKASGTSGSEGRNRTRRARCAGRSKADAVQKRCFLQEREKRAATAQRPSIRKAYMRRMTAATKKTGNTVQEEQRQRWGDVGIVVGRITADLR